MTTVREDSGFVPFFCHVVGERMEVLNSESVLFPFAHSVTASFARSEDPAQTSLTRVGREGLFRGPSLQFRWMLCRAGSKSKHNQGTKTQSCCVNKFKYNSLGDELMWKESWAYVLLLCGVKTR